MDDTGVTFANSHAVRWQRGRLPKVAYPTLQIRFSFKVFKRLMKVQDQAVGTVISSTPIQIDDCSRVLFLVVHGRVSSRRATSLPLRSARLHGRPQRLDAELRIDPALDGRTYGLQTIDVNVVVLAPALQRNLTISYLKVAFGSTCGVFKCCGYSACVSLRSR